MPRRFAFAIVAACAVFAIAAGAYMLLLRDDEGETTLHASEMTVVELYAAVGQKLRDADGVTHIGIRTEFRGIFASEASGETWIEPASDRVRESVEVEAAGQTHGSASLTTPEERFSVSPNPRSPSRVGSSKYVQCHGASVAASLLLTCPELGGETTQRVEEGKYRGRDVFVLVEEGRELDGERQISFISHLYLDAGTLMPIEMRSEGLYIGGTPLPFVSMIRYGKATIVSNSSLGSAFFEPEGIGYVAPDPLAAVRAVSDLQVYWLGQELTLPDGRVIFLQSSYESPGRGSPHRLQLQYATRETPHEPPFLTLMVFHRDMWERSPAIAAQAITFGDVVVFVNAQALPDQQGLLAAPGSLEFVFSRLRPFEP